MAIKKKDALSLLFTKKSNKEELMNLDIKKELKIVSRHCNTSLVHRVHLGT